MKLILSCFVALLLAACGDSSTTAESSAVEITAGDATQAVASGEVAVVDPCSLLADSAVAEVFEVDAAGFERYARNPYPDTKRCEYLWSDPNNPIKGRQLTVTISANGEIEAMPRRYSNMLRMDIEKGLMATAQQVIKPTAIDGFGEFAYAWGQSAISKVSKIKFQKEERYLVEVMFSTNDDALPDAISVQLKEVGQMVWAAL